MEKLTEFTTNSDRTIRTDAIIEGLETELHCLLWEIKTVKFKQSLFFCLIIFALIGAVWSFGQRFALSTIVIALISALAICVFSLAMVLHCGRVLDDLNLRADKIRERIDTSYGLRSFIVGQAGHFKEAGSIADGLREAGYEELPEDQVRRLKARFSNDG